MQRIPTRKGNILALPLLLFLIINCCLFVPTAAWISNGIVESFRPTKTHNGIRRIFFPVSQSSSRLKMAMPELPPNVEKYSQVPSLELAFTATTIPDGLKKDHTTKARTWGVIRILKGKLEYIIDGTESFELSPSLPGIIQPERKHHVKALTDDVEFVVEFHREVEPQDGADSLERATELATKVVDHLKDQASGTNGE